jgi:hypothetical protein
VERLGGEITRLAVAKGALALAEPEALARARWAPTSTASTAPPRVIGRSGRWSPAWTPPSPSRRCSARSSRCSVGCVPTTSILADTRLLPSRQVSAGDRYLTSTTLGQLVGELGERLQLLLVDRHQFFT